jgi:hypothetical protein
MRHSVVWWVCTVVTGCVVDAVDTEDIDGKVDIVPRGPTRSSPGSPRNHARDEHVEYIEYFAYIAYLECFVNELGMFLITQ